jgi:hypothetical protein
LNERRLRPEALDCLGHRTLDVDKREKLSLRISFADGLEHLLAASHAREPVVDEGDLLSGDRTHGAI